MQVAYQHQWYIHQETTGWVVFPSPELQWNHKNQPGDYDNDCKTEEKVVCVCVSVSTCCISCFDSVVSVPAANVDPVPSAHSNINLFSTWQDECYNYIKVLVPRNDETLFACGTNAFNPTCRNYKVRYCTASWPQLQIRDHMQMFCLVLFLCAVSVEALIVEMTNCTVNLCNICALMAFCKNVIISCHKHTHKHG